MMEITWGFMKFYESYMEFYEVKMYKVTKYSVLLKILAYILTQYAVWREFIGMNKM